MPKNETFGTPGNVETVTRGLMAHDVAGWQLTPEKPLLPFHRPLFRCPVGDPRRFHAFADVIARALHPSMIIADVAGGKGYLQAALRERGFRSITTWDRRRRTPMSRRGHRYGWFTWDCPARYDAIVAMHPDEATDHAILYAAKHQIPALICPCCVRPSARLFLEPYKYHHWCRHLASLATQAGLKVAWTTLPINGRRDVMILTPPAPANTGNHFLASASKQFS